ncbi:MAG: lysylphosphatidylglycerol synthase domain-containing protein, partial [Anaerolineales bacterium]
MLIVILVGFVFYIPLGDIFRAVLSVNIVLFVVSFLLNFPSTFLTTWSTHMLAFRQGIRVGLWDFFLFNLAIRFYSYFSPASMVSTAMRWHKLSAGSKSAEALSAISFSRLFSIVVAIGLGLFWVMARENQATINLVLFLVLAMLMVAGWILITRLSPALSRELDRRAEITHQPFLRRLIRFLARYFHAIDHYATMPLKLLLGVALMHLGNDLLGLVSHILLAQALGIPLSIYDLGWLRAIAFLSALVPFTLAGGIGLREVSLVIILSSMDVG